MMPDLDPTTLDFDKADGLVPVIAQHWLTGEVLMLGYATREALNASLETGLLTFHSRSRNALWTKGETSGNTLRVVSLHGDCDDDAVLARVDPTGPTCHTGSRSCFRAPPTLRGLADVLEARLATTQAEGGAEGEATGGPATSSSSSYTVRLLRDRNLRLKKLGEEAGELAVACADEDRDRVKEEAADVVYHTLVAALAVGVGVDDILESLESRRG
ncbi:MAG: bifunctional phosphoribosyl-AMP cyclohydrolase/phosphoribosyl-ATP diphosphatase HisIE [Longimicrobiales bacterium]